MFKGLSPGLLVYTNTQSWLTCVHQHSAVILPLHQTSEQEYHNLSSPEEPSKRELERKVLYYTSCLQETHLREVRGKCVMHTVNSMVFKELFL